MNTSLSDLKNSYGKGFIIPGKSTGDRLGSEVYGAGDINGDGIDDLVVTATDAGIANTDAYSYYDSDRRGQAYVVFGSKNTYSNPLELDSLNGNNGFAISGLDAEHNLGDAVAAGDINGDGIDDLVLGAPQAGLRVSSYGYSYSQSNGEAYVIFGRQDGFDADLNLQTLNGGNGFTVKGIDAADLLGTAVSSGGDINGDGIDDLAISAAGGGQIVWNNGAASSNRRGEVYVLFGSQNGFDSRVNLFNLNGSNGFIIDGQDSNDSLGSALSSAGDINGDGIDDLIISAPNAGEVIDSPFADGDSDQRGEVYVLFGSQDGFRSRFSIGDRLNGNNGFILTGIEIEDNLGSDVSSVGDINGDGIDDLIIGAANASTDGEYGQQGEVYVVFGRRNGFGTQFDLNNLDGRNGFSIAGIKVESGLGNTVSAGDFNGDGIDDLLVGASNGGETISAYGFEYSNRRGEAYIIFGNTGFAAQLDLANLSDSEGIKITGINEGELLGSDVSSGDFNDDGADDLAISATGTNIEGEYTREGTAYVIFGTPQNIEPAPLHTSKATPYNDKLYGTFFGDIIAGQSGDDTIDGGDGDDELFGDGGGDSLIGGRGRDTLAGGNNNDTLVGGQGKDFLNGGNNQDRLIGDADNDTLVGGGDNDRLEGGAGDDVINGTDPSNYSVQLGEQDTLIGGDGADLFILADEERIYYNDRNWGTEGSTDYAFVEDFNPLEDKIQLKGDRFSYSLSSYSDGLGNRLTNVFYLQPGAVPERIAILKNIPADLTLDSSAFVFAQQPTVPDVIVGQPTPYNDEIVGSSADDLIAGQSGDDTIFGGFGNDTLDGEDSGDSLFGQQGDDILYGRNNNDFLYGGENNDLLYGGNNQDRLNGDSGSDTLYGGTDNDLLDGGLGNDTLNGTDPNNFNVQLAEQDTLIGGEGADLFILADENRVYYDDLNWQTAGSTDYAVIKGFNPLEDKIQLKGDRFIYSLMPYADSQGKAWANLFYQLPGAVPERIGILEDIPADLTLDSSAFVYLQDEVTQPIIEPTPTVIEDATPYNDKIDGSFLDDTISGDSGYDTIYGANGNDLLYGDNGNDLLLGEAGTDTLSGGNNNDTLFGGIGDDQLNGDSNQDRLIGDDGNDLLLGGTQNDLLEGGDGNDTLIGADYGNLEVQIAEQDTLIGGAGSDFLILGDRDRLFYNDRNPDTAGASDYALISDFDFSEDTIQLQGNRSMYDLTFYTTNRGTTSANLLYLESGSIPERIAIIENAPLSLTTADRAFFYAQ